MSEPLPPLNSDDVKRVQKIFVLLLGDMDGFARTLYSRLFELAPEVETMFSEDMDPEVVGFLQGTQVAVNGSTLSIKLALDPESVVVALDD